MSPGCCLSSRQPPRKEGPPPFWPQQHFPPCPLRLWVGTWRRKAHGLIRVPSASQMLAKHVITLHVSALTQTQAVEGEIDLAKLKKFIAYCRA